MQFFGVNFAKFSAAYASIFRAIFLWILRKFSIFSAQFTKGTN